MAIDRSPRRAVETTLVPAASTLVETPSESPLLSGADLEFTEDGSRVFVLHTSAILGAGGQGTVCVAEDEKGNQYAAKLSFQPQSVRDRLTRNQVMSYLERLVDEHPLGAEHFRETHLMPVIAHGQIVDDVPLLGLTTYDVTIMPICDDQLHTRGDVSYEEIVGTILPQAAIALHNLHEARIVHRDVKPGNLYYMDGSLVLGDFGISSVLDEGRDTASTQVDRRTPGYSPHSSTVQRENDWYSLGYTIWCIYNGNLHPHQALIDADDLSAVLSGQRPVRFEAKEPAHEGLGQLIMGLTFAYSQGRLGFEDVQHFLESPTTFNFVDPLKGGKRTEGYQFEGATYALKDLPLALAANWERGKRHLYTHGIEEYLRSIGESDLAVRMNDIVEMDEETARDQDLGLSLACTLLDPAPLRAYWKGGAVDLADFRTSAASLGDEETEAFLGSGLLPRMADALEGTQMAGLAPTLRAIGTAAKPNPDFAREYACRVLASEPDTTWQGANAPEEMLALFQERPKELFAVVDKIEPCARALAALAAQGHLAAVQAYYAWENDTGNNTRTRLTQVLQLFESCADDPSCARRLYYAIGEMAWVDWLARHPEHYRARNGEGSQLVAALSGTGIDCTLPIVEQAKRGADLFAAAEALRSHTEASPYLHEAGIVCDGDLVEVASAEGYFTATYLGQRVPAGFARTIGGYLTECERRPSFEETTTELREDATRRMRNAADELEENGKSAGWRSYLGEDSLPLFVAKIVTYLATIVGFAYAWPGVIDVIEQANADYGIDVLGLGIAIPAPLCTNLAYLCLAVGIAMLLLPKLRAIVGMTREHGRESRNANDVATLRSLATATDAGTSAAESYLQGTLSGNVNVLIDASTKLLATDRASRGRRGATSIERKVFVGSLALCATLMVIASVAGLPIAFVEELELDFVEGLPMVAHQVLYVLSAAACFGAIYKLFVEDEELALLPAIGLAVSPLVIPLTVSLFIALLPILIVIFVIWLIFVR